MLGSENRQGGGSSHATRPESPGAAKEPPTANTGEGVQVGREVGEEARLVLGVTPGLHPRLGSRAAGRKNRAVAQLSAQWAGEESLSTGTHNEHKKLLGVFYLKKIQVPQGLGQMAKVYINRAQMR